jgi:hypothetical protein
MNRHVYTGIVSLISIAFCLFSLQLALAIEPGKIKPTQQAAVKQTTPQTPGVTPSVPKPPVHTGNNDINVKRDFSISDIKFPSVVYEGDPIEFNSSSSLFVQVSYSGLLPSPQCRVKITCSGIGCPPSLVGEPSFTSIQPGQSKWVSLPVYGTNNAKWGNFGACTFDVVVDPDGSCGDTNTANNKRSVSVTIRKKIQAGLTAPSDFKAVLGEFIYESNGRTNVNSSWTDNSTAEEYFKIELITINQNDAWHQVATAPVNTTQKTMYNQDGHIFPNKSYMYRISACNGTGACSEPVTSQTITTPTRPVYPTNIQVVALSKTQIKLTWNDVADEWAYWILRKEGENYGNTYYSHIRLNANTTSYTDVMLQPNTEYCYKIRPVNAFDPLEEIIKCATTPAQ